MKKQQQRQQRSQGSRRPLVERLENRQLLHAVLDVRLPGGAQTATVDSVGDVVNFEIWVNITGHDSNTTNDGLQSMNASLLSSNVLGGAANGTISTSLFAPFNGNGSQAGTATDLDGDGDLDVGSNNNSSSVGFFLARANAMQTGTAFQIGTGTFTVTSLNFGLETKLVARPRVANTTAPYVYLEDGAAKTAISGGVLDAGPGIIIKRPGASTVRGRVFHDKNANGIYDLGVDAPIDNFRVFLDKDFDGVQDADEPGKQLSSAGTYTFTGVETGIYRVRQVAKNGWRQTNPGTGYHEVVLGYGFEAKNLTIANTDNILIKGKVWLDSNKNRFIDNLEGGLPGWTVYIDHNKNGILDEGDDSTLADAKGNYRFFHLKAGNYHVYAIQIPGHRQTTPASVFHDITLVNGQTTSNKNFGIKRYR